MDKIAVFRRNVTWFFSYFLLNVPDGLMKLLITHRGYIMSVRDYC